MTNLKLKSFKSLSLSEFGLWLLIPFASLTSHTWLPIPPTMVLLLGAIVCWFVLQMQDRHSERSRGISQNQGDVSTSLDMTTSRKEVIIVFSVFTLYIFVSQYLIDAPFRRYMGVVLAPLYLLLMLSFSEHTSTGFLKKLGEKFIRYSLVILSVEAILRYAWSFYLISQGENYEHGFYQFKFGGPMYHASNMVALHLIVLLFFMLWWGRTQKKSMKKELTIAFVLLALTLSRAAIPSVFVGLIYYRFFRDLNWEKALLIFFLFCIVALVSLLVLMDLFFDGSFQSKFLILQESLEYYKTANLKQILFGIGFYETGYIMTHYAHNYFLLFFMESGVIGFLLLCTTWFYLIKTTRGVAIIILLPFFIQANSEGSTFMPYFYVAMAFLVLFSNRKLES
ncbi:MAG: O-antigen ligase family protein [Bacteroidales bacterium]|nr:O-antigen ligase family protein [Bacteroidales bacterium]